MTESSSQTTATGILRGSSTHPDPVEAARELAAQIGGRNAALCVVYVSPSYDHDLIGPALFGEFADSVLVGCTTAGEIGPDGYLTKPGVTGFTLPKNDFEVDLVHLEGIGEMGVGTVRETVSKAVSEHRAHAGEGNSFAILLVDGMSMREETVTSVIHGALGDIPLCGGSAGDNLDFGTTRLLVDGRLASDTATLALVRTTLPFEVFKIQHFNPTATKLVVTAADPTSRVVTEIDGVVASQGYAEAVGMDVADLSPEVYSRHPVVVRVGGHDYVRSIQRADPDGSLVFYCAIDNGLVLTIAEGVDLVQNLEHQVDALEERLGGIQLTVGFDCILRRLESMEKELSGGVDGLLRRLAVVGFATYGEQFGAMHVNQTLTGVAIGGRSTDAA